MLAGVIILDKAEGKGKLGRHLELQDSIKTDMLEEEGISR
jgi:hypothetical protein